MSHFSCLVIGPDVEKQLAPYHEFECTGTVDEYVQDVDETEELRKDWEEAKKEGEEITFSAFVMEQYDNFPHVKAGDEIDRNGDHKWGWIELDAEGNVLRLVRRTNPNKHWDWWVVGGRYRDMLQDFCGTRVNQLLRSQLDLNTLRAEAVKQAEQSYDHMIAAAGGKADWKTFDDLRAEMQGAEIDDIRKAYWGQPQVAGMKAALKDEHPFFFDPDRFRISREAFVEDARLDALCTYAFVRDGQWHSRGTMLMFGVSVDESPRGDWRRNFEKMLDEMPGDTLLTVVDCHI